jgi:hypothetical protein
MATKAKPGTAVAVSKPSASNIVSIREQIKANLAAQAGKTEGGSKKIKFDRNTFTLPSGAMFQAPMRAVIVDFNTHHSLYEKNYKAGEISPIICAALGDNPRAMAPYASIASPQCGDCNGCWANEFKSATNGGNGKACKQVRTLAVMVEDANGVIDPKGPIFLMQTNVTANKVFDAFVKSTASIHQLAPVNVVVSLGIDSSNPTWNFVTYDNVTPLDEADMGAFMARLPEAKGMLNEEVTVSEPTPEPVKAAPAARGKVSVAARR